jgi:hypothetical protein
VTILHFDGTTWTNVWSGTSERLLSLTGTAHNVFAGGEEGLLHLAGRGSGRVTEL